VIFLGSGNSLAHSSWPAVAWTHVVMEKFFELLEGISYKKYSQLLEEGPQRTYMNWSFFSIFLFFFSPNKLFNC
jgi:hypothetical protein